MLWQRARWLNNQHHRPNDQTLKEIQKNNIMGLLCSCSVSVFFTVAILFFALTVAVAVTELRAQSSSDLSGISDDDNSYQTTNVHYFPDSQRVLDMAQLSHAVYKLRNKVESCDDVQAKNKTRINNYLLRNDNINHRINNDHQMIDEEQQYDDIYKLLLPNGTICLHYSHDYTLGTQVLIVRSTLYNYVAVAYAGTDDWKTALTDGDILTSEFGPSSSFVNSTNNNSTSTNEEKNKNEKIKSVFKGLPDGVRVHRGFNSNVFDSEDFVKVLNCVKSARLGGKCDGSTTSDVGPMASVPSPILTTGHSLGAANSVLLGAALHLIYPTESIRSINFGCPKVGNTDWSFYINSLQPPDKKIPSSSQQQKQYSGTFEVFRFVNKIDIVPRLPELPVLIHVGHTLQMSIGGDIRAYYDHIGNESLGYAGVEMGWEASAFAFLPGALDSHPMSHYNEYLDFYKPNSTTMLSSVYYVNEFERVEEGMVSSFA